MSNPTEATVLLIDDDETVRRGLYWALNDQYRVLQATSRAEAAELLEHERVDVILCDLHLPPNVDDLTEGLAIIDDARRARPAVPVVAITGSNSKHAALEAVKRGAYGFFQKPVDAAQVLHIVRQTVRMRRLPQQLVQPRDELSGSRGVADLL